MPTNPYKLSIRISADTQEAQSNIDRLNAEFGDLLKSLGKTPEEVRAFSRLAQEFVTTGRAADDLDHETKQLLTSYRDLVQVAKSRDLLGLVPAKEIERQIHEVESAFDTLKRSGVLSQQEIAQAAVRTQQRIAQLKKQTSDLAGALSEAKAELAGLAASTAGIGYVVKQAMDFESAMAEVAKTTGASGDTLARLGEEIKELSTEIPRTVDELARMAAAGGQLGVPVDQLQQFTKLASEISVAFGVSADEAAQAVAKMSNVFGLALSDVERLSDAVNTLGNDTSATERDILEVLTRVGGMSKQFGLAAEDAAALGAALLSLGKTPEIAATGINALLTKLQTANVAGKDFKQALDRIGISAEQLAASIRANPQAALLDFLRTLQQIEPMARSEILVKLFGLEYQDDIAALIGSLDQYEEALGLVADKQRVAGAMQREFAARLDTTEAQLKLLRNAFNLVAIDLGKTFLPLVRDLAKGLISVQKAVDDFVKRFPLISQLATTLVTVTASVGALRVAFLAAKVAALGFGADASAAIKSLRLPLGEAVAAVGRLQTAFGVLSAYLIGQDIGKYLSDRFEIVRKAGVFMAETIATSLEYLKTAWESLKAAFTDDTLDQVIARHQARLEQIKAIFGHMYKEVEDGAWQTSQAVAATTQTTADAATQTVAQAAGAMAQVVGATADATADATEKIKSELAAVAGAGSEAAAKLDQLMQSVLAERDYSQIEALVLGLQRVRQTSAEAAQIVQDRLTAALAKLSAEELEDFQSKAVTAFEAAGRTAQDYAWVLEAGVSAALTKLGVDVETFRSGMTSAEKEALSLFSSLASSSQASSEMVAAALDALIGKISSTTAIDQLRAQVEALGQSGVLSVDQVTVAMRRLDQAAAQAAGTLSPVAEAMRRLGVESAAELDRLAEQARRDFETIRDSGTATAGEVAQAFEAYAQAAMRAARAHGSAQAEAAAETLEAERSVYGLTEALDEAGTAGLEAGQKIAAGMGQSAEAAEQAAERVREAAERTREAAEKASEPHVSVTQWVDPDVWQNMTEAGQREIHRMIDDSFKYMWKHRTWSGGKNIVQDQLKEQIRQIEKAVETLDDLERRYLSGGLTDQIAAQVRAIQQQVGGFVDLSQWSVAQAVQQGRGATAPGVAPGATAPSAAPAPAPVTVQPQISGGRTEELLSEMVRYLAEIARALPSATAVSPEQAAEAVLRGIQGASIAG